MDTIMEIKIRKANYKLFVTIVLFTILFGGCQNLKVSPLERYSSGTSYNYRNEAMNLDSPMNKESYIQKVDNLLLIVNDNTLPGIFTLSDENTILTRIENTIQNINLTRGIRTFGPNVKAPEDDSTFLHRLAQSPDLKLKDNSFTRTMNFSLFNDIAMALDGAYNELKLINGNSAIIIISDFINTDKDAVISAESFKNYFGDRVCLYPVILGNHELGNKNANDLVKAFGCGYTTAAEALETEQETADYMKNILFDKVIPVPSPSTPVAPVEKSKEEDKTLSYEKLVKEKKITIELKTEFDLNRSRIRPEYNEHLKKIAEFMWKYPNVKTCIEGHTCSLGTEEYNYSLSLKRALSIKKHLVEIYGVDPDRLSTVAYGESLPIADNATPEGRERNRRAIAVLTATIK